MERIKMELLLSIPRAIILIFCRVLKLFFIKLHYFYLRLFKNNNKNTIINKLNLVVNWDEAIEAAHVLKKACSEELSALGFDCEWINTKTRRPVALLQLSTTSYLTYIFRLNILKDIPLELRQILCDENVIKVGITPLKDATLLYDDYQIQVKSTLDLRHLYKNVRGLAYLAEHELGIKLDKSSYLQCSNWENPKLTHEQMLYAANDSKAGIALFKKWLKTNYQSDKQQALETCFASLTKFLDIPYKNNLESTVENNKKYIPETIAVNKKKSKPYNITERKTPLYQNCFIHAPDGDLLCSCDKRKAEWYINKGLAKVFLEEPYSIKLLFNPAGRANGSDSSRYYQQLKQNHCVVCGNSDSYIRHHVVPREYRKHFPKFMTNHQSHDIVLLCIKCHSLAYQHYMELRQDLAVLCDAPLTGSKTLENQLLMKIKNSAKALLSDTGNVIPQERKQFLEKNVKNFYNVDTLTEDILLKAASLETKIINKNYISHGLKVTKHFEKNDGGLFTLEKLWRKYFLKKMNPQHLPALWSVTHNH